MATFQDIPASRDEVEEALKAREAENTAGREAAEREMPPQDNPEVVVDDEDQPPSRDEMMGFEPEPVREEPNTDDYYWNSFKNGVTLTASMALGLFPEGWSKTWNAIQGIGLAHEKFIINPVLQKLGAGRTDEEITKQFQKSLHDPDAKDSYFYPDIDMVKRNLDKTLSVEEKRPPQNATEEYFGQLAEFAGGSALPVLGMASKAKTGLQLFSLGLGEATSVVGAATGEFSGKKVGKVVDRYMGEDEPFYENVLGMTGLVAGAIAPLGLQKLTEPIYRWVDGFFNAENQGLAGQAKVLGQLSKVIEDTPETIAKLDREIGHRASIPGYRSSIANVLDDPSLKKIESDIRRRDSKFNQSAKKAEEESQAAIQRHIDENFPDNAGLKIENLPDRQYQDVMESFTAKIKQLDDQFAKLEAKLPEGDAAAIGNGMREVRNQRSRLAQTQVDAAYNKFYALAEEAGLKADGAALKNKAVEILGEPKIAFQVKSPALQKLARRVFKHSDAEGQILSPTGAPLQMDDLSQMPMEELHSFLKSVSREHRAFRKNPNADQAVKVQLRDMENYLKSVFSELDTQGFAHVNTALKEANSLYFKTIKEVFRDGIGGKMVASNAYGERVRGSKIVEEFVMESTESVDEFFKIYGRSKESMKMLSDGVLDLFARKVVVDGKINPTKAKEFMNKYNQQLSHMPEIKQGLADRRTIYERLANRRHELVENRKKYKSSEMKRLTGHSNPEILVEKAIAGGTAGTLKSSIAKQGGEEGILALRHQTSKLIAEHANPEQFILDNQKQLAEIFDPDHMSFIKRIAHASKTYRKSLDVKEVHTTADPHTDWFKKVTGTSGAALSSMMRQAALRIVSPLHVATFTSFRFAQKVRMEKMDRMWIEALYDPEIAKNLKSALSEINRKKKLTEKDFVKIENIMFQVGYKAGMFDEAENTENSKE